MNVDYSWKAQQRACEDLRSGLWASEVHLLTEAELQLLNQALETAAIAAATARSIMDAARARKTAGGA